jgi:DHA1 family tetracycline resistance protein-like MFS transporter
MPDSTGRALPRGPLAALGMAVFVDLLGFGIVLPLLPLWAERFGASPIVIGLLLASYAVMQFLLAPVWGRVSDRVGRRPVILVALAGSALAALALGLADALWMIFLARIFHGAAGASYSVAQAYVADVTEPDQRARGMGMIGAAFGLGFVAGPAIGAVTAALDPRLPFLFAAALAAVNFVVAWRVLPESLAPERRGRGSSRVALLRRALGSRAVAPLVWMSFVATLAFVGMESTFALFMDRRLDFGPPEVAWAFAYVGLLAAASQGLMVGPLVRRFGEPKVLLVGLVITGVGLLGLALVTNVGALLVALAPLALGSGLVFSTTTSLISRRVGEADQGGALGLTASVSGLARIVAPIGATVLFQALDPGVPLAVGGVMFLACAVALGALLPRQSETGDGLPVTGSARDV